MRKDKNNDRERMVLWTINQLKASKGDFITISEKRVQKNLAWYKANKDKLTLEGTLPRQAYTLVLLKYMCINSKEVPAVYENERKIIWHSFNFCPYLETCKRLNFNSRVVCKEAYEKPVQILISCLHPNLKFSRNYSKIRPYEDYREEIIELID